MLNGNFHRILSQRLATILLGASISTLIGGAMQPANALVQFTVRQVGGNIEVNTSGSYSTAGLSNPGESAEINFSAMDPGDSYLLVGPTPNGLGEKVLLWDAVFSGTPGTAFGAPGVFAGFTSSTTPGSIFGFNAALGLVYTDVGLCPSGDPCSPETVDLDPISALFPASYANLGLLSGVYLWSWGNGDVSQQIQLTIEPVPGPLPALGASAAFAWSRRLRRRVRARQLTNLPSRPDTKSV